MLLSHVKIFPLGGVSGAAPPNVTYPLSYLRNYYSWKVEILHTLRQGQILIWGMKIFRNGASQGRSAP